MYSTRIVYDLNLGDLLRLKLNVITDTWCGCYACECVCVLMLMLQIKCAAAETGIEKIPPTRSNRFDYYHGFGSTPI